MKTVSKTNWAMVDAMSDDEIDYTDNPELTEEMFQRMQISMPDKTKNINIRLKESTVEFFKQNSNHYQSLINAVLDAYVSAHKKLI